MVGGLGLGKWWLGVCELHRVAAGGYRLGSDWFVSGSCLSLAISPGKGNVSLDL